MSTTTPSPIPQPSLWDVCLSYVPKLACAWYGAGYSDLADELLSLHALPPVDSSQCPPLSPVPYTGSFEEPWMNWTSSGDPFPGGMNPCYNGKLAEIHPLDVDLTPCDGDITSAIKAKNIANRYHARTARTYFIDRCAASQIYAEYKTCTDGIDYDFSGEMDGEFIDIDILKGAYDNSSFRSYLISSNQLTSYIKPYRGTDAGFNSNTGGYWWDIDPSSALTILGSINTGAYTGNLPIEDNGYVVNNNQMCSIGGSDYYRVSWDFALKDDEVLAQKFSEALSQAGGFGPPTNGTCLGALGSCCRFNRDAHPDVVIDCKDNKLSLQCVSMPISVDGLTCGGNNNGSNDWVFRSETACSSPCCPTPESLGITEGCEDYCASINKQLGEGDEWVVEDCECNCVTTTTTTTTTTAEPMVYCVKNTTTTTPEPYYCVS